MYTFKERGNYTLKQRSTPLHQISGTLDPVPDIGETPVPDSLNAVPEAGQIHDRTYVQIDLVYSVWQHGLTIN